MDPAGCTAGAQRSSTSGGGLSKTAPRKKPWLTQAYNGPVPQSTPASRVAILTADTTADVEQRQVDVWRRLSPREKLQLVSDTTCAMVNLSLAGIRSRHPQASERECFLRLAAILLGVDTARRVYPDAAQVTDLRGPC